MHNNRLACFEKPVSTVDLERMRTHEIGVIAVNDDPIVERVAVWTSKRKSFGCAGAFGVKVPVRLLFLELDVRRSLQNVELEEDHIGIRLLVILFAGDHDLFFLTKNRNDLLWRLGITGPPPIRSLSETDPNQVHFPLFQIGGVVPFDAEGISRIFLPVMKPLGQIPSGQVLDEVRRVFQAIEFGPRRLCPLLAYEFIIRWREGGVLRRFKRKECYSCQWRNSNRKKYQKTSEIVTTDTRLEFQFYNCTSGKL